MRKNVNMKRAQRSAAEHECHVQGSVCPASQDKGRIPPEREGERCFVHSLYLDINIWSGGKGVWQQEMGGKQPEEETVVHLENA